MNPVLYQIYASFLQGYDYQDTDIKNCINCHIEITNGGDPMNGRRCVLLKVDGQCAHFARIGL